MAVRRISVNRPISQIYFAIVLIVFIANEIPNIEGDDPSGFNPAPEGDTETNDKSGTSIAFDLPDLTAIVETTSGFFQLEAYKSIDNDQIIRDVVSGQTAALAKTSQLFWVSVGQPDFVKTPNPRDPAVNKIFHNFTSGFNTYIQMLTPTHRRMLAGTAQTKYHVEVNDSQIVNLILSKFECTLDMFDDIGNKYLLKGRVLDFRQFPLRMDFQAPPRSKERKLFVDLLADAQDLEFVCTIASAGKLMRTRTLVISGQQQQLIGLEEKLFGEDPPDNVFVTRNQLVGLTNELYSTLNIAEDYRMSETQFKDAFYDDLVSQIASNQFALIPIDIVLASLSRYGFDVFEDWRPAEIKQDLKSLMVVEKQAAGKSRIVLNETGYRKLH